MNNVHRWSDVRPDQQHPADPGAWPVADGDLWHVVICWATDRVGNYADTAVLEHNRFPSPGEAEAFGRSVLAAITTMNRPPSRALVPLQLGADTAIVFPSLGSAHKAWAVHWRGVSYQTDLADDGARTDAESHAWLARQAQEWLSARGLA